MAAPFPKSCIDSQEQTPKPPLCVSLSFYLIFKYCEIARADIIIIISSLIRTLKFPSIVDDLSYESRSLGQVSLVVLNLKATNR